MESVQELVPGNKYMHTGVYGPSGSGKSYLTNEVFKAVEGSAVYFNAPRKQADDYNIPGHNFSSRTNPGKIKNALKNGEKVKYNPSSDPDKAVKQLKGIYAISRKINSSVRIFIDEAHRFSGKLLSIILDDGRGHEVFFSIITQYPKRIKDGSSYGDYILQTIEDTGAWIIFDVSNKQKGFFEYYNMPYEKVDRLTDRSEFAFVVMQENRIEEGPLQV